ncbi:rCG62059, partial [Rattus norvegicus]
MHGGTKRTWRVHRVHRTEEMPYYAPVQRRT